VPDSGIADAVAELRRTFETGVTRPYAWRADQLARIAALVTENESSICDALRGDLEKSPYETILTEIRPVAIEVEHTLKHLKRWMAPRRVSTPISNQPGRSEVVPEPLGVVLVVAPWNYPFHLAVLPMVGALAAGNCAVVKPSELVPRTSALLAQIVPRYLDADAVRVIEGGVPQATELLAQRFDHIFFTGSPRVGTIVLEAAAKHLTPVTLELGGKSPCIVHKDADIAVAARRIAWGKYTNAGQTCVAPDYVLAHEAIAPELIAGLKQAIADFYGPDPADSPDYARIVNDTHFERIVSLMSGGDVAVGGQSDPAQRYIAPTVLTNPGPQEPLMNEEIFGPLLPVRTFSDIRDAITFVNARPKPLALYLFAPDGSVRDRVLGGTSSGGVCINDVVMHLVVPDLPFGGVGHSGMGAYHGRASFDTFSHAKSVLTKAELFEVPLRYPPYTETKIRWVRRLT